MKTTNHNKHPTTTVSVDAEVRDLINEEAERLRLSQKQMIQRLYETHADHCKFTSVEDNSPDKEKDLIQKIHDMLEKVIQRDDRIIAFIREQERLFLSPTYNKVLEIGEDITILLEVTQKIIDNE